MANLIEMSEQLKGVPDDWLQQQVQNPSGAVPPYLMLSELNRRKALRSRMTQPPTTTVAEDILRTGQPPPPGMSNTDVLANRPQMPQQPQTPRPGVSAPMPGGLQAAAPAAPQGPPAPQRMAGGGLIRAYGGALIDPYAKFRRPTEEEEEDRRGPGVYYDPAGSLVRRAGKPDMIIAAPPKPQFAPYREPTPVDIKMPDLASVLEQVRSVTREPEGASAKLDQRIAELEQQRRDIRQPRTGDALIEMGLGMMASRSPYALGAMGEAGLGALQSHRARQTQAQQQQTALSERLAAIEAARYEQAERGRRSDLSAAQELASKQYGAEMVKAQLQSTADSSRRSYDLAVAEAQNRSALEGYQAHSGLQKAMLQADMQERHRDPNDPAVLAQRLANEKELIAERAKYSRSGSGYGGLGLGKQLDQWEAKSMAHGILRQQIGLWDVADDETAQSLLSRSKPVIANKVASGEILGQYPAEVRRMIAYELSNYGPDKNDAFWGDTTAFIKRRRAEQAGRAKGDAQEDQYGSSKSVTRSGADKGVRDLSELSKEKAAAPAVPAAPARRPAATPAAVQPRGRSSLWGPVLEPAPAEPSRSRNDYLWGSPSPTASLDLDQYLDQEDYHNRRNDPYYNYYLNNLMGGFAG